MPEKEPRRKIEITTSTPRRVEIAVKFVGEKIRNPIAPPDGPKGISPN